MSGRAKRCTKCKYFKHSKRKVSQCGFSIHTEAKSIVEAIADYYCPYRWWNSSNGRKAFAENDVCEHFKFKNDIQP